VLYQIGETPACGFCIIKLISVALFSTMVRKESNE
jgi:hypothetical protein